VQQQARYRALLSRPLAVERQRSADTTLLDQSMTAEEFTIAKRTLGETDDQLAATLGVTPHVVRAWSQGTARIPRRDAKLITFLVAAKERAVALESSRLPECAWFLAHEKPPATDKTDDLIQHAESLSRHYEQCPTCQAREKYVSERFGPMPSPPSAGFFRLFEWVGRVPPIARPAAVGAALLATLVLVRVAFSFPRLIKAPGELAAAGLALLAAAAAGATGGFAYSLTRPTFKRLGRPGDYLTGIVCVLAYMGSLAFVAPFAFGEPIVEDRAGWVIMAIVSIIFGLVIGHTWFRSEPAASR
jgi:DNA-binding transcriptional regulator YiaG